MKKRLFLLLIIIFMLSSPRVQALTPTPTVPTSTPSSTPIENGLEKVKEIRDAVKEKVREKIDQAKLGQKFAYVGEITKINEDSLLLATFTGQKTVTVSEETKIIGKGGKNLTLKNLKVDDFCLAMGYRGENDVLEAKRLVITERPVLLIRQVAYGRVTDISIEEKILTVKNERKGMTFTVLVTDKTMITKKIGTKVAKVKFADIKLNDYLVAVGTPQENEEKLINAKIIHVIPGQSPEKTE